MSLDCPGDLIRRLRFAFVDWRSAAKAIASGGERTALGHAIASHAPHQRSLHVMRLLEGPQVGL